jgi:hypothetical protein
MEEALYGIFFFCTEGKTCVLLSVYGYERSLYKTVQL